MSQAKEAAKKAPLTRGPARPRPQSSRGVHFMGEETIALYKAHETAKRGEQVMFPVINRQRANHLLQRLRTMGLGCIVKYENMGRTIIYPSGGRLIFKIG